jgi:hypothetical protein
MQVKSYNFQNPQIRQKASDKAASSKRPSTYRTKRKKVEEVEKELIREELLKQGFVEQIGSVLPQINAALIKSASRPTSAGSSDRRIVYTALNILTKEKEAGTNITIGQLLADLAKTS